MAGLGPWELGIILVIIMIIFGAGKLPDVARSLGQGVKEFKKEASEEPGGTISSTTVASDSARVGDEPRVVETRREMRADEI